MTEKSWNFHIAAQCGKTRNALSLKSWKLSWNQLFSNFLSKDDAFTKFLSKKSVRENFHNFHTVCCGILQPFRFYVKSNWRIFLGTTQRCIEDKDLEEKIPRLLKHYQEHIHNKYNNYAFGFFFCEILNVIVSCLSVYLTHKFLLEQYFTYGIEVYRWEYRPGQPNWEYTMWKFRIFLPLRFYVKSIFEILEVQKMPFCVILETLNFDFWEISAFKNRKILNKNFLIVKIFGFWTSLILKIDFSGWKIIKFPKVKDWNT